jgi:glycosyltransferase involved in cell wall biosynthesis
MIKNRANKPWRVAVVVQRYGEEVGGGAEQHARWLAEHLLPWAEVHAITTCALDYTTWANHYPAGHTTLNGVKVHRFAVDKPRDWASFQRLTAQTVQSKHSVLDELEWMRYQGPLSTPLLNYLQEAYPRFDLFIFFTYVYATTFFGLPLVCDKAILVPTAHDEPYLYLSLFRSLFHLPRVIVYNTETERELVGRVTRNQMIPQVVAGIGINVPADMSAARFRQKHAIEGEFLLYVGRVDPAKNVPELLDYFLRFRQEYGRPLKLVLIGRSTLPLPAHPDIIHLGFLPEADKFDALQAASVMVIPSLYESLSMITLEAWFAGIPALVHGRCEVTKQQCRLSNGGLYYISYDEFAACLHLLLDNPGLRAQLGANGGRFARHHYDWAVITAKYRAIFAALLG